ncbi:MAG: lytic transglycosylase domain-containing protein, partial [Thermoleophilia bacterium]|nr:lytic transglycosylase domain-containing protein [Thermoleophilia bacterium]
VEVGVVLLRHLLRRFDGNERLALAAWYQGERAVRERGVYVESRWFAQVVLALRRRGV